VGVVIDVVGDGGASPIELWVEQANPVRRIPAEYFMVYDGVDCIVETLMDNGGLSTIHHTNLQFLQDP
jgi:hypothetical protein